MLIVPQQAIFGGSGSSRTQWLVLKRSILVEVYQSAHQIIENNFYLTHHTIRHSTPKMIRTLAWLGSYIESTARNPHIFMAGCSVDYEVVDQITEGFRLLQTDTDLCKDTVSEATGADIGVN